MLTKYAALVNFVVDGPGLTKQAHRADFAYEPRPGFLYIRSRAISSRCNDNFDSFPAAEIQKGYRSFIGKPVFVNHVNEDHHRARGVVIDAALHHDVNPDGSPDTWAEVLMEVDAMRFPKLARAIVLGHVDRTSMGVDVEYSICSACGNRATTPAEYCRHIPQMKGSKIIRRNGSTGRPEETLIFEECYGLSFFENSLLVEDPADPTAYFLGVDTRGLKTAKTAAGLKPLPVERGLYYRSHPKEMPFGRAHARTQNIGEAPAGMEHYWEPKEGYSAFWSPHHVQQYHDDMGWDFKGRDILAFRGHPVGEGADGEPRVMPDNDKPVARISPRQFQDRLEITPYHGRYDEHTWGEDSEGQRVDDGYRRLAQKAAVRRSGGLQGFVAQDYQPSYLYHHTDPENRDSISEHGLDTRHGGGGRIYLSGGIPWGTESADIWRADVRGHPMHEDNLGRGSGWAGAMYTEKSIPPERLKLIWPGHDRPNKQSERDLNQVRKSEHDFQTKPMGSEARLVMLRWVMAAFDENEDLTSKSPGEIDQSLADHHDKLARHEHARRSALDMLHHLSGDRQTNVGRTRKRVWGKSDSEVLSHDTSTLKPWNADQWNRNKARHDEAVQGIADTTAHINRHEGEFSRRGGWSRFFTVPDGHIHSSRQCHSCRPTTKFGWQPELSGKGESEAVDTYGPHLCTHCFPSAPTEWKRDPTETRAEEKQKSGEYCAGGKASKFLSSSEVQDRRASHPQNKLRVNPGEAFYAGGRQGSQGRCPTCETMQKVKNDGNFYQHKPPEKPVVMTPPREEPKAPEPPPAPKEEPQPSSGDFGSHTVPQLPHPAEKKLKSHLNKDHRLPYPSIKSAESRGRTLQQVHDSEHESPNSWVLTGHTHPEAREAHLQAFAGARSWEDPSPFESGLSITAIDAEPMSSTGLRAFVADLQERLFDVKGIPTKKGPYQEPRHNPEFEQPYEGIIGKYLYHHSPPENRQSILEHGLTPHDPQERSAKGSDIPPEDTPHGVYLGPYDHISAHKIHHDIWAVDTNKVNLEHDPDDRDNYWGFHYSEHTIPPHALTLVHKAGEPHSAGLMNFVAVNSSDEVPPEMGTSPIPAGHVRLYHQTGLKQAEGIREHGIAMEHARDISGPRGVWASHGTQFYGQDNDHATVEFHVPYDELRDTAGGQSPHRGQPQEDWEKSTHHTLIIPRTIHPHEISAIHLPWHDRYRYFHDNDMTDEVKSGGFDHLKDMRDYGQAIDKIKREGALSGRMPLQHILDHVKPTDMTSYGHTWPDVFKDIEENHVDFAPQHWSKFLDHVQAHGIQTPVVVLHRGEGEPSELFSGHHRIWAAHKLGLTHVPTHETDDPSEAYDLMDRQGAEEGDWRKQASLYLAKELPQTYFHGTTEDLQPGDIVRPGNEMGLKTHPQLQRWRGEHVWATPAEEGAWGYSGQAEHQRGTHHQYGPSVGDRPRPRVYEVEPMGPVQKRRRLSTEDPEEYTMPAARVVRRIDIPHPDVPSSSQGKWTSEGWQGRLPIDKSWENWKTLEPDAKDLSEHWELSQRRHPEAWAASEPEPKPEAEEPETEEKPDTGQGRFFASLRACLASLHLADLPVDTEAWKSDKPAEIDYDEHKRLWDSGRKAEADAMWDTQRAKEKNWNASMRRAISIGHISPEEASAKGFKHSGHEQDYGERDFSDPERYPEGRKIRGWQDMPHTMYHVTTNAPAVLQHGLKSRYELDQERGVGLGGGDEGTVSTTNDLDVAHDVHRGLHEMRQVARGERTIPHMVEEAKSGKDAEKPFWEDIKRFHRGHMVTTGEKPDISPALSSLMRGMRMAEHSSLSSGRPEEPGDWRPHPDAKTWKNSETGEPLASRWERPATHDEKIEDAIDFHKTFAWMRGHAGGPSDPLFTSSDPHSLARVPAHHIQILKVHPRPGAKGYPMGAMKEWRTSSGDALDVEHEPVQPKTHFARLAAFVAALEPDHEVLWHLTDQHHFEPDPERHPQDAAFAIQDRSNYKGLYVGNPERWTGNGYHRPYVAEIHAPEGVAQQERWHGEKFIPAEDFDKVKVHRVIPYDAYVREQYGSHGPYEEHAGKEFDTGKKITETHTGTWHDHYPFHYDAQGEKTGPYHYTGKDVRDFTPKEHTQHLKRLRNYLHEVKGWGWNEFNDQHEHVGVPEHDIDNEGMPIARDKKGNPMTRDRYAKLAEVDHSNHLPNPQGGHDWHHGTPHEFERFDEERDDEGDEWDETPEHNPHHWNTHLGSHWTSLEGTAEKFAKGKYGNYAEGPGNIFTANLGIKNPKHYERESDMDTEAFNHAWDGHDPENVHAQVCHTCPPETGGDDDFDDPYEHHWLYGRPATYHLDNHKLGDEVDTKIKQHYYEQGGGNGDGWLSDHPDAALNAEEFKNHLRAQGHDGVTYGNGNPTEGPIGHKCAITFDTDQIHNLRKRRLGETEQHAASLGELLGRPFEHEAAIEPHPDSYRTLYRGLHFGELPSDKVDDFHKDPEKYLKDYGQWHQNVGIHWTDNPDSAYNFATDRDPEGWAHENDEYDEDEPHGHNHGVILEGRVHNRHIIDPESEEGQGYAMSDAILGHEHPEQEVTVRGEGKVHVHQIHAITEHPEEGDRWTTHKVRQHHLAGFVAALGEEKSPEDAFVRLPDGSQRWGRYGAAGLLLHHKGRYMLQHRSGAVQQGGTWSTPGGALKQGEDPFEGAKRELKEETGLELPPGHRVLGQHHDKQQGGWAYHTTVVDMPEPPHGERGNWESKDLRWFTPEEMGRLDLHPGFAASLPHLLQRQRTGAARHPGPFVHSTDAELEPGDMVESAATRGHQTKWGDAPGYRADRVYMHGPDSDPVGWDRFGKNHYEVQPIGRVSRDPEWRHNYRDYAKEEGYLPEETPGYEEFVAPRARVIRKLEAARPYIGKGWWLTPEGKKIGVYDHYETTPGMARSEIRPHMAESGQVRVRSFNNQLNIQTSRPFTDKQRQSLLLDSDKHSRVFVDVLHPDTEESIHSESGGPEDAERMLSRAHRAAVPHTALLVEADQPYQGGFEFRFTKARPGGMEAQADPLANYHRLDAFHSHTQEVTGGRAGHAGYLLWHHGTGVIGNIGVNQHFQRQGLATELLSQARDLAANTRGVKAPRHSPQRTDAGEAWARSTGDRLPRRTQGLQAFAEDEEWRGGHQPSDGPPIHDLLEAPNEHHDWTAPDDIYEHMHYYRDGEDAWDNESHAAIREAHKDRVAPGSPLHQQLVEKYGQDYAERRHQRRQAGDHLVTVYRAAPRGLTHIGTGDWVTPSQSYARQHGVHATDPKKDWPVYKAKVPAKHVRWAGDSLNEFGYFGDPVEARVHYRGGSQAERLAAFVAALSPDEVQEASPEEFHRVFSGSIEGSPFVHHVTNHTPDEIRSEGMKPLTANGGKTGVLVHDHRDGRIEATGLYNQGGGKGAGEDLLKHAVQHHGVNYVEAYGPTLPKIYERAGFHTTEKYPFDDEQAHPDWDYEAHDRPDYHIMRTNDPNQKTSLLDPDTEIDWNDPEQIAALKAEIEAKLEAEGDETWARMTPEQRENDWAFVRHVIGF